MALNGLNVQGASIPVIAVAIQEGTGPGGAGGASGYEIPQQDMHSQAVIGDITAVADPHIAGALWKNAGVITISAG